MRDIVINFKDGTQATTDSWGTAHNYYNSIKKEILTIFIGDDLVFSVVDKIDTFLHYTPPSFKSHKEVAYKETKGKLFFELDWGFVKQMAERMASNKKEGKYSLWNWKKPMDVEELKQATMRHLLEVMEGVYEDDGREFGHLEAISNNIMMINYQLKHGQNN